MPDVFFATSKIIHLLQFKLFLTIFKCIYVSFFYLNYLQNLNTYVLLSIKSFFFFGARTTRVFFFSFLEILAKPSCILTFSSCGCKEESRADHRGHVGLCGLSAISELKRTIILCALSAQASASVSRTMFIHPKRIPFHQFSVIWWTVSVRLFTSWRPRAMWQPRAC